MKLTKRIVCLLLAMVLAFALCACGEKADNGDDNQTPTTTTATPTNGMGGNLEGDQIFNDGVFSEW